jgi:hypothetical protein
VTIGQRALLVLALLGGGLSACNDPGLALIVANDSSREVLVHYRPSDPELRPVVVNSPARSVAVGLGGMNEADGRAARSRS